MLVNFPNGTGPQSTGYDISLVAADGRVVAHAHAATRAFIHGSGISAPSAPDLPEVSVTNGRVYYLNGDSEVRYLAPDGSSATVTTVPGSSTAHAGFAINQDGSKIAVSILAYQASSATMTLYIDDVAGGNRHDIFQSATEYAWPIAWRAGNLVLGIGPLFSQQGLWDNPYFAANLHVVDSATGNRIATIGGPDFISSCEVSGPLVPTGIACYHRTATSGMGGVFLALGWDGMGMISPAIESQNGGTAALDPDLPQTLALLDAHQNVLLVVGPSGRMSISLSGTVDSWPCWLDDTHIVVGGLSQQPAQVVEIPSGVLQPVNARGY
ncbi:MAG TPA: hypothetical protein VHQ03_03660, partial [Candidatus Dormibacteraeota bacterium]|nr:hypothetical protein [Candidatus Dormibacteraeota bacterium]